MTPGRDGGTHHIGRPGKAIAMTALDRAFVQRWSTLYEEQEMKDGCESRLFDAVGPRVHERGYYTIDELVKVDRWKNSSGRNHHNVIRNEEDDVRAITSLAFEAPEHLRHRILSLLYGVGTPVASALLTVWRPDVHTVIDYRAIDALHLTSELPEVIPATKYDEKYPQYNTRCRVLAKDLGVKLRTLDKALWMAGKASDQDGS